jgi:hypothetical protein
MLTRNLDITYSMVWVIVLSNIIAVGVSFLFLNQLVRLTHVKAALLVPFLMVLTAFGAYTAHNSLNDILLMLAATAVGIAAIKWDWPRAPLLLALVLGDIAERYLFLSYSLYEWSWLTRPLVIVFGLITVGGVVWPLIRGRRHSSGDPVISRADIPITAGCLIIGIVMLLEARGWPFRTAVFPLATGFILVGLSLMKLVAGSLKRFPPPPQAASARQAAEPAHLDDFPDVFATASRREWLAALGWMGVFFASFWLLGALITVPLFAIVYLLAVPRCSPVLAGVYALASWGFVYGLFGRLLRLPLP